MNQKQLEYFLAAYETGNIQQAADKLFVSRQGVSKLIRELEKELGSELFQRSAKGIEATDFAKALLPHVRKLLDEYACISGMNSLAGQKKSLVTIYALDHILEYFSADFLRDFRKAHPDVILSFVESTDDTCLDALLMQNADFAITTGPVDNTRFIATPLFYARYCVSMAVKHPLADKQSIGYADLVGQKIISKGRAYRCFRNNMDKYVLLPGLAVDIFAETADANVTLDLVASGEAVSIGYDYTAVMHKRKDVVVRFLDAEVGGQEMYLVALRDTLPTRVGRSFQSFLLKWLPEHGKDKISL